MASPARWLRPSFYFIWSLTQLLLQPLTFPFKILYGKFQAGTIGSSLELCAICQMRRQAGGTILLRDDHVEAAYSPSMYQNNDKLPSLSSLEALHHWTLLGMGSPDLVES